MPREEDVLALARAVVKHGGNALLIKENNVPDRWVAIEEAVTSGRAFAVEPKPGLVALDLDSAELVAKGVKVKGWAETYLHAQTVLVASGGDGRRHLWVCLPSAVTKEDFKVALNENYEFPFENIRHTQATRPPLSPHRNGLPVSLIEPTSVEEALERLGPADGEGKAIPPKGLTGKWARLLRDGDTEGRYEGRHQAEAAIAQAAVRVGLSKEWFISQVTDRRNKGGAKTQEIEDRHGREAAFKSAGKTYDNAVGWVTKNNVTPSFDLETFKKKIRAFQEAAEQATFTRSTDRDVLLALIRHAEKHSSYSPMASVRDLHIKSGRAIDTVRKALQRLVEQDWLTKGEPVGETDTYTFNLEMSDKSSTYSSLGGTERVCTSNVAHPLFTTSKGLAGRPAEVWVKLPTSFVGMSEAVTLTGLKPHQIRAAAQKLAAFGLAEIEKGTGPKGGNRYRSVDVSSEHLDRLADELNIHEDQYLKKVRIERQRAAYSASGGSANQEAG
ncbi:hypothetical protein SMC26_19615 [Actinomadura fulvescens]|uniref:Uncharacterized protein n=1 Tax=Actinomadura fulvescens TaxID=46160 RepID=A0ABP6C4I5_9ACTN